MKKKLKIENPDFAHPIGKSSILRIDWKSFEKEMPLSGQDIWVVLRVKNGYIIRTGTYFNEVIPANGPFKASIWKQIKFHDLGLPDILVGKEYADKNQKRLVAWGAHRGIVRLAKLPEDWKPNASCNG
jgi:hypothetical protein